MSKQKELSYPKMGLLGLQHMFAMFGATVLVPILTGMSVQLTLVGVGIGTLIFHIVSKGKVPAFLGSSFAFLVGIQLVTDETSGIFAGQGMEMAEKLSYATGGIFAAGFVYLIFAAIIKFAGVKRVMRFLPPVVTAPTVILIGIMLAPFAINQSRHNLPLAIMTLAIVVACASWGRGMVKIVPILIGLAGAYVIALIMHAAGITNAAWTGYAPIFDFSAAAGESIVGLPPFMLPRFGLLPILVMIPFAIATIAEHIGDMVALSSITKNDFLEEPGLHRTLAGDGLASVFAGLIGAPSNTTYGENVGVVVLTKVFNPRVVQIGAIFAIVLGLSPLFDVLVRSIPTAVIGGASFMLYGMIAAVGVRNLVETRVDVAQTKNLVIIAVMLVTGLGMRFGQPIVFHMGDTAVPLERLGIVFAVLLGIILNIILPTERSEKDEDSKDTA